MTLASGDAAPLASRPAMSSTGTSHARPEGLASETELLDLTNGVDETQSELVDGAWRLIAFAHPDVAEERGWVLAD